MLIFLYLFHTLFSIFYKYCNSLEMRYLFLTIPPFYYAIIISMTYGLLHIFSPPFLSLLLVLASHIISAGFYHRRHYYPVFLHTLWIVNFKSLLISVHKNSELQFEFSCLQWSWQSSHASLSFNYSTPLPVLSLHH